MKMCWVNFGSSMYLVDEYGRRRGVILPLDTQIHYQIERSLYEPNRAFGDDEYKMLGRPPDRMNKGA